MPSHRKTNPTTGRPGPNENFAGVSYRDTISGHEAIRQIKRLWGDTLAKNLAVANIVVNLQRGYVRKANYDDLGLPFQYSWFRRLIKIGKHPDLNYPDYRSILPDARTTLYQIALLNHKLFLMAVDEQIIHLHTTAKEVEQWRKQKIGCRSQFLVKLTISEAAKLKDILKGKAPAPNQELMWKFISLFEKLADQAGCHVKVIEIVSDRLTGEKPNVMKARKGRTPAETKKLRGDTHQMQRPASDDDRWEL